MENIELDLIDIGDMELSELFDMTPDIDFDDIKDNSNREVSDKTKKVSCPECWFTFDV